MTHRTHTSHGGTSVQRLRKGSATDDWWTPPEILDALPSFDLDPCVPLVGPSPWSTTRHWYTLRDDGLMLPWGGHVWLNPPYSSPAPWLKRMSEHNDGIALIFARTETGWWHDHVWGSASSFLWLRRRVSFRRSDGTDPERGHNAPAPSVLVAWGEWADEALAASDLDGYLLDGGAR